MPLNSKDLEEITKHPENYNIYIKEGVDGIQLNEHNAKMLACDNGLIVLPEAEGTENMYIYATMLSAVSEGVKQKLNFKEQSKLNSNDKRLVDAVYTNTTKGSKSLVTWETFLKEKSPFHDKTNQELISIVEETKVCIASGPYLPSSINEKNARVLKYKEDKLLILYPSLSGLSITETPGALHDMKKSINNKDSWKELCSVDNSYKEYILKCLKFVKFKPTDWEDYLNTAIDPGLPTNRNVLEEFERIITMSDSKFSIDRSLLRDLNRKVLVIPGGNGLPELNNQNARILKRNASGGYWYVIYPSLDDLKTKYEWGQALDQLSKYIPKRENFKHYYNLSTDHKFMLIQSLSSYGDKIVTWETYQTKENDRFGKIKNLTLLYEYRNRQKMQICVVEGDGKALPKLEKSNTQTLNCKDGIIIYPSLQDINDIYDLKLALYTLSEQVNNQQNFKKYFDLEKNKDLVDNALEFLNTNKAETWEDFLQQKHEFKLKSGESFTRTNGQLIDEYLEEKK